MSCSILLILQDIFYLRMIVEFYFGVLAGCVGTGIVGMMIGLSLICIPLLAMTIGIAACFRCWNRSGWNYHSLISHT